MSNLENITSLAKEIAMWRKYNQTLIPEDVLNMMIDKKLLTKREMKDIVDNTNFIPSLPDKHFPIVPEPEVPDYTNKDYFAF